MSTQLENSHISLVNELNETMIKHKLILVYQGEINQMITKTFSSMAEREMETRKNEEFRRYKKLYHVMVESLQNICKHSAQQTEELEDLTHFGYGMFMVSQSDNEFCITTGNNIKNKDIKAVTSTIDELSSLNPEEIKALYRKRMKEGALSEKGGAGLGFIDIVKKTGNKIEYSINPISDTESYFIQKIKIN